MPSEILDRILVANHQYAESFGTKSELALRPARGFAILACMDARLDPAEYAGLAEGNAHVIRSLVISYKLLATCEFFVIHHTDCGMRFFTNEVIAGLLEQCLETVKLGEKGFEDVGTGPGSSEGRYVNFLTISDPEEAVREDVARIANHPLVPKTIPVRGFHLRCAFGTFGVGRWC